MKLASRLVALAFVCLIAGSLPAMAQAPRDPNSTYGPDELVNAGHQFFGNVSRGLASVIERAVSNWGLPNGYVLGEEGGGAFVAGLLAKRNQHRVLAGKADDLTRDWGLAVTNEGAKVPCLSRCR